MSCNLFMLCLTWYGFEESKHCQTWGCFYEGIWALFLFKLSEKFRDTEICHRPCLFKYFYFLFQIIDWSYYLIKWTLNFSNYVGIYSFLNCQIKQHSTITKQMFLVNYWMVGKGLAQWCVKQQHFSKNIQSGHLCQFSKYPRAPITPKLLLFWHS